MIQNGKSRRDLFRYSLGGLLATLRPTRSNGGATWNIVGLMQGHFRIYNSGGQEMLSNGLRARTADSRGRESTSTAPVLLESAGFGGGSITLQELESRIRRALNQ